MPRLSAILPFIANQSEKDSPQLEQNFAETLFFVLHKGQNNEAASGKSKRHLPQSGQKRESSGAALPQEGQ
jgi:hypothetical protein